jgi:hypothetical protein
VSFLKCEAGARIQLETDMFRFPQSQRPSATAIPLQLSRSQVSAITSFLDSTPRHGSNQSFSPQRINYQMNLPPPEATVLSMNTCVLTNTTKTVSVNTQPAIVYRTTFEHCKLSVSYEGHI